MYHSTELESISDINEASVPDADRFVCIGVCVGVYLCVSALVPQITMVKSLLGPSILRERENF